MRTYSREDWQRADHAWCDFDPLVWGTVRRLAAQHGMLFPPTGTVHDDREGPEPSQRAIVYRALEDNPAELLAIVRRSSSWNGVVDRIFGLEARLRTDADYTERDAGWERDGRPDEREAVASLGRIIARISDSVGGDDR